MKLTVQIIAYILLFAFVANDSFAQNFHLVKDINSSTNANPENARYLSSTAYSTSYTILNSISYFSASDGLHGVELWRSDGTTAGTYMVKDIDAGLSGSGIKNICVFKNQLYFTANDGLHGTELWKSDGTSNGTSMVKDINPGAADTDPYFLMNDGKYLYFPVSYGGSAYQFWKSDGTDSGTVMLKDFTGSAQLILYPCKVGEYVCFFVTTNGQPQVSQLWRTNGTATGTIKVKDISGFFNYNVVSSNGKLLYFGDLDGALWKSNGTESGTSIITYFEGSMSDLVIYNNLLLFTVDKTFFKSDGTAAGTTSFYSSHSSIGQKTVVKNKVFFVANTDGGNHELWQTDVTPQGTSLVKKFDSGYVPSGYGLTAIGNKLYFSGYTLQKGYELWKSDGTEKGTINVMDIYPGAASSNPGYFSLLNKKILFSASDGKHGNELWITDTLSGKSYLLKDINVSYSANANPSSITPYKGKLYFIANNDSLGNELWKTDGTEQGTTLVKDINKASLSAIDFAYPMASFLTSDNNLYFAANTQQYGMELWKTDDDSSSTKMVYDLSPGGLSSDFNFTYPGYFHAAATVNGRPFFVGSNNTHNIGLFSANSLNTSLNLINSTSNTFDNLTPFGNKLFYVQAYPSQLWITDSTAQTNRQITTAQPDGRASLFTYNQFLYFGGADGYMWKTDGTNANTKRFKNIRPDPYYYSYYTDIDHDHNEFYVSANGIIKSVLYFAAYDSIRGSELWKTNGKPGGTVLVKDINTGKAGSELGSFTVVNKIIYFLANDGKSGRELWKTDGTTKGTIMVKDITTGSASSEILSLTQYKDKVIFLLYDGTAKTFKLWQSDGTSQGTMAVNDASLNDLKISPPLKVINDQIYFAASSVQYGSELWVGTINNNSIGQISNVSNQNKSNLNLSLKAQPNPVSSDFQLLINNTSKSQRVLIQVINTLGRVVYADQKNISEHNNTLTYNAANWTAGLYIIRVTYENGSTDEIKILRQ